MFCSRDRKAALTPDADMEDDQNGCAALIEKLQETFCFYCCVHVCNYRDDRDRLACRSDGDDQHIKIKCFR